MKIVWDTPKHVGGLWYRCVMNKKCAFSWCSLCQNCTHPPCGGSQASRTIVLSKI